MSAVGHSIAGALRHGLSSRFAAIWVALLALILVGAIFAPTSVSGQSLENLIFFASLLGLAALGQHLVIAVGGLDLSISSQITLAAIVFAESAQNAEGGALVTSALLAVGVCLGFGLLNGIAVTTLRITPLIATLGVGGIALSAAYAVHGEAAPSFIPAAAEDLALNRSIFGMFAVATVVCVALAAVIGASQRFTPLGRRFTAVGANPRAARLLGVRVDGYRLFAYVTASLFYALAGLVLAGVAGQPGVALGSEYLLPSIAAVVVGGTLLGGGVGSVAATLGGALFMTQLDAVTLSLKATVGVQLIVQGTVIALAMALYSTSLPTRIARWAADTVTRLLATSNPESQSAAPSRQPP